MTSRSVETITRTTRSGNMCASCAPMIPPSTAPGASAGAHFLEAFVAEDMPWAHIDMAPTMWADRASALTPKGPTGFFKFYRELWDEKLLGPRPTDDPRDFLPEAAAYTEQAAIPTTVDLKDTRWLPSFNLKWNLNEEMLIRFGVSKGLSRPKPSGRYVHEARPLGLGVRVGGPRCFRQAGREVSVEQLADIISAGPDRGGQDQDQKLLHPRSHPGRKQPEPHSGPARRNDAQGQLQHAADQHRDAEGALGVDDQARADHLLAGVVGKRLTYRTTHSGRA